MTRNDIALIRQRALFNGQVTRAEVVAEDDMTSRARIARGLGGSRQSQSRHARPLGVALPATSVRRFALSGGESCPARPASDGRVVLAAVAAEVGATAGAGFVVPSALVAVDRVGGCAAGVHNVDAGLGLRVHVSSVPGVYTPVNRNGGESS